MKLSLLFVICIFSQVLVAQSQPEFPALEPGIKYVVKKGGTGPVARPDQIVALKIKGRLADGTTFLREWAPSYSVGSKLPDIPKGLLSVLPRMKVGESATVVLTPEMGFGHQGHRRLNIPPNAELTYDIEVTSFSRYWLNPILWERYNNGGFPALEKKFLELKKNGFPDVYVGEGQLNFLGWGFLFQFGRFDEGLRLLKWNTELHPESANAWDSLAAAYYMLSNRGEAIKFAERASKLDPRFKDVGMAKWLRSRPQSLTAKDRLDLGLGKIGFFKGPPFENVGPNFTPIQELLDAVLKDPKQANDEKAKLIETFLSRVDQFGRGNNRMIWDRYLDSKDPVVRDAAIRAKEKVQQAKN